MNNNSNEMKKDIDRQIAEYLQKRQEWKQTKEKSEDRDLAPTAQKMQKQIWVAQIKSNFGDFMHLYALNEIIFPLERSLPPFEMFISADALRELIEDWKAEAASLRDVHSGDYAEFVQQYISELEK